MGGVCGRGAARDNAAVISASPVVRLMSRASRARRRRDDGTILMLTLGFLLVTIMLAVVVTDVSAVYLARRSVASAADGAALAAAQRVNEEAVYAGSGALARLPLADVMTTVADYQDSADPSGATQLSASLLDADTVEVRGSRVVDLPLVGFLGVGPVTVHATADAETVVRRP
jgi:Flp pilus assembly protein TadG